MRIVTSFRIKMPDNVALIAPKDSPECQIYSDRMRLTQVISNFLNNAIKYTSEGCIILAYEIIGDEIKFSVTDTGDGMSQEIQSPSLIVSIKEIRLNKVRAWGYLFARPS